MIKLLISLTVIVCLASMLLGGCASDKVIDGKSYKTYGLLNKESVKDPCVNYEASMTSAVLGAVFFEMLFIPPIYVYGFSLWEPVSIIKGCGGNSKADEF